MPVSIVVGGQFGSEGKGKVSLELARRARRSNIPTTVVRVGGPNSGHTGYDKSGKKFALRQLPAGCIDRDVDVVFPAGSYIDVDLLLAEVSELDFPRSRITISHHARVITQEHKDWEHNGDLIQSIGSTGAGVGAAVMAAVARRSKNFELTSLEAQDSASLQRFLGNSTDVLRKKLDNSHRVIIEGTQGFGLSLLDGGYWPKATSRSTTAAAALAETGLSPLDVDDVTLVIRSFPIRVAGDSGPLPNEVSWDYVSSLTGRRAAEIQEYTTVTKKLRRVGKFDPALVRAAIAANRPNRIVMNHLDYIGGEGGWGTKLRADFIKLVEEEIDQSIDWWGVGPLQCIDQPSENAV
ncbi:adenylosuccinate synthetase [Devosia sp.]|uniref:adenylosuccinate synthetase n=1 Tax=Devosia sp. TaxID=1871048 RepID=UPI001A03C963|nr:adenylosuccinate synthetase [Devosia sp.]MBE0580148.1 adenylosuccinate synthetase [Devosia sp.]